jgi:hypothetical protein
MREPIKRSLAALAAHSLPLGKTRTQHWIEQTRILSLPIARWKVNRALDRLGLLYQTEGPGRVVSPDGKYGTALTGATAVALLAELAYSRAAADQQFMTLRSAWLDALISLRIPGGGFRKTPDSIDQDDYSNGEAWLALAVYCDVNRDDSRCALLGDVDGALLERYSAKPTFEFYHWGAMSAAQRFKTTGDPRFVRFLQQQANFFEKRLASPAFATANRCAPMEGVAAALAVLRDAGVEYRAVAESLRSWLSSEAEKLPKLQIQQGQDRLRLGGDAVLTSSRLRAYEGAFLVGLYAPSVQVDTAAHCLAALIMIERDRLLTPASAL